VRRWPGLLAPGLVHGGAAALLEAAYHPDPREADTLGTEPIRNPGALEALGMTEARWGESARRGLQRMLRHGVTAVAGPYGRPAVRTAVARAGVLVVPPAQNAAEQVALDPLAAHAPQVCFAGTLAPGSRADFAVFDVPTEGQPLAALADRGAGSCVATVLAGRLLHRRR
jgi:cytosine/adenosine deaminase-related metal-dependent hydrolase